jgi:hypothetical protein
MAAGSPAATLYATVHSVQEPPPMRAASIISATIVVLGLYLALAAGLDPTWIGIGIGMLGIGVAGAVTITLTAMPIAPSTRIARS